MMGKYTAILILLLATTHASAQEREWPIIPPSTTGTDTLVLVPMPYIRECDMLSGGGTSNILMEREALRNKLRICEDDLARAKRRGRVWTLTGCIGITLGVATGVLVEKYSH